MNAGGLEVEELHEVGALLGGDDGLGPRGAADGRRRYRIGGRAALAGRLERRPLALPSLSLHLLCKLTATNAEEGAQRLCTKHRVARHERRAHR